MKHLLILPFFLLLVLVCGVLKADTIYLKDGQEVKGVVVEDYHDRIIISTEKGEVDFLKKDIDKVAYETPEENFVKLGALYKDKGDYKTALYYYESAYKLNPNMKAAREGTLLANNLIIRKKEFELEDEVKLRQDIENKMGRVATEADNQPVPPEARKKDLFARVGIVIDSVGSDIKVTRVSAQSPAYEAGITKGDIIVSVWGKLLRYMQLIDVYNLFLGSKLSEMKMGVLRDVSVTLKKEGLFGRAQDIIGGKLNIELEGLIVESVTPKGPMELAGVQSGDRIIKIGDIPTRYMPLDNAYLLIKKWKMKSMSLQIQRELTFWKS